MTDSKVGPKRSVGKILGIILGSLLVLLVVLYFVATSSGFIKAVILPKVANAIHADIKVDDIDLSPFSQIVLHKLRVQTTGSEPLVTADEVRARYALMDIVKGNINVSEVTLLNPVIQIVKQPDGASNLDPITKGESKEQKPQGASKTANLDIRNINLKEGSVSIVENLKGGGRKTTQLRGLNLTVDKVQNGQPGKLTVSGQARVENAVPAQGKMPAANDVLAGKLEGAFDFAISNDLKPASIKGSAKTELSEGAGAYAEVKGLTANVDCDLTPTELRQLVLRFERGGKGLGRFDISGPLDLEKTEGKLSVKVSSIDREILNLAGAAHHWDFGSSTFNSTNSITLANQAKQIGVAGELIGRKVEITQSGNSTPPVDLDVRYELECNLNEQQVQVRKLELSGKQENAEFLRSSLDKPMTLTWGGKAATVPDAALTMAVTAFDLNRWKPVIGTNAPSGVADLNLKLTAVNNGQNLKTETSGGIKNLAMNIGSNRLDQAAVTFSANGTVANLRTIDLPEVRFKAERQGASLAEGQGSARYDLSNKVVSAKFILTAAPAPVLQVAPVPQVSARNGGLRLDLAYDENGPSRSVKGALSLTNFTGGYAAYAFTNFTLQGNFDVALQGQECEIKQGSFTFQQGATPAGGIDLTGKLNLDSKAANLQFKSSGINENTLRPILASSLGKNELISITFNASGSAVYDPKGQTELKADLSIGNWVVENLETKSATPVLTLQAQADVGMKGEAVDIRTLALKLAPTPRANNQLQIKGHLDLAKTNPSPGQLSIQSDGMDVTPYYDMFAGKQTNAPAKEEPAAAQANGNKEPDPMKLPVEQLTADLKIDRFYLREIAISNWVATVKVNHGEVGLKPFQMNVNGGPLDISGLVNVGVPGYRYDLGIKVDRIPLAPLANSFSTDKTGRMSGYLVANGTVKGAGITGASMQKNLNGNVALSLTNLNLEIVGRKTRNLLEPIAIVLGVPEILNSPLTLIDVRSDLGGGNINLSRFFVDSPAFEAEAKGPIPINEVFTNSPLNLPVTFSLRRAIAEKARLLSADTPTNAAYAALPPFVKVEGTIGSPKSHVDKLVISGLLLRSVGGIVPRLGDKGSSIVQGIGGILSGQQPAPRGTNAPAVNTNAPGAAENVLRGLSGLLGGNKPSTNAPAQSTNAPAKPNPLDLFKLLPKK